MDDERFVLMGKKKSIEGFGDLNIEDVDIPKDQIPVFLNFKKERAIGWAKLSISRLDDAIIAEVKQSKLSNVKITSENLSFSFCLSPISLKVDIYELTVLDR